VPGGIAPAGEIGLMREADALHANKSP
jgi:hypothetical protein